MVWQPQGKRVRQPQGKKPWLRMVDVVFYPVLSGRRSIKCLHCNYVLVCVRKILVRSFLYDSWLYLFVY